MSQRRTDNFLFPSIAKEHFHDYVEKLLQKPPQEYGSLLNQLQVIQQICNTEQYKRSIFVPTPTQQRKDRYLNVHPSVDYRVKLPLIKDDPESDYVNACWFESTLPGASTRYIATQAPVSYAFYDFWRMVWHYRVPLVLMLTDLIENDKVKADKYWSDEVKERVPLGDIAITLLSISRPMKHVTLREFQLSMGSETRTVQHIQYTGWPDHGAPDPSLFENVAALFRLYREFRSKSPPNSPVLFHCSAGVGRNGTFITIDVILDNLASKNPLPINVFNALLELRVARPGSIQTVMQYEFVFRFLDYCIEKGLFGTSKQPSVEADSKPS